MAKVDLYPKTSSPPSHAKVQTGTEFLVEEKVGADVNVLNQLNVSGTFTPTGLQNGFLITTQSIGDTAALIPTISLAARNAISIRNLSQVDTLYIGPTALLTADSVIGTTSGWEVGPNESFNVDVTDAVLIYGICETGKTVNVKILEMA